MESVSLSLPARLLQLLREWPGDFIRWWNGLTFYQQIAPTLWVGTWWIALFLLKGYHTDHLRLGLIILGLSYAGRQGRAVMKFLLPFALTAILYDSMQFYNDAIRGAIHVNEPYLFDKALFGIHTAQGVLTPNEWFQIHHHWFLDLITGFAYLTFFTVYILDTAFFYFWVSRKGTAACSAKEVTRMKPAMGWSFFWLNLVGYSTYYWYAAAPPWYVSQYGLGPARMDARPSAAGCVRFDQLLGTHFFDQLYGRSNDVFGAIPSLHIAYPLLGLYFAFRFGTARVFNAAFYLVMVFSAIYLNHHYVLDVLWGSAYALTTAMVMDWYYGREPTRRLDRA